VGVSKFPKLVFLRLWRPINLCLDLWLKWVLKKSCSIRQDLSNGMSHATYTQGNRGDSWLLVVRSQIGNLTFGPFFGHILCFKYSNGLCEPILNIYVPRSFNDTRNFSIRWVLTPAIAFWKSIGTLIPKMSAHLGVWGFIPSRSLALSGTWNVIPKLPLGPHLCKPLPWSQAQGQGCDINILLLLNTIL